MKRSYAVYQVDAFTKEKLSGNPAGVVLDARGLTGEEMRRIARELNNSETNRTTCLLMCAGSIFQRRQ